MGWSSGVSITEICAAAGWATPSTFARFYNLDIPALQARVLSAYGAFPLHGTVRLSSGRLHFHRSLVPL